MKTAHPFRFRKWPAILVLSILLAFAAALWLLTCCNDTVSYLPGKSQGNWILYPSVFSFQPQKPVEMTTVFSREFAIDRVPEDAVVRLSAFKEFDLHVNHHRIGSSPDGSWKRIHRFQVSHLLQTGRNTIAVQVVNETGPPALWLSLSGSGLEVFTDSNWWSSLAGATDRPSRLASNAADTDWADYTLPAAAWRQNTPWREFKRRLGFLVASLAVSGLGIVVLPRLARLRFEALPASPARFEALLLIGAMAAWAALFWHNRTLIPPANGFDTGGHLDYVRYILEHRKLPLAEHGWQMYQPPLFYMAAAFVLDVMEPGLTDEAIVFCLRVLTMIIGLLHLFFLHRCLTLLFPANWKNRCAGLVFAGFLPMHLYIFHYVTNEGMSALLMTVGIYLCLKLIRARTPSVGLSAILGVALGLGLLAKFTGLLLAPVIVGALVCHTLEREDRQVRALVKPLSIVFLTAFAVAGWHYLRVWLQYGNPFVGNWEITAGGPWWQYPGYRMSSYFFSFGESLIHPLFSGLRSFGDAFYASLWGDGWCSGLSGIRSGTPWNTDLQAMGFLLALFPTACIAVGTPSTLTAFLRRPSGDRFIMLGLSFLAGAALILMTLQLPFYGQTKAFYAMGASVCLTYFFVVGFDKCAFNNRWARRTAWILLLTWAMTAYGSYWIDNGSPAAHVRYGTYWTLNGNAEKALERYNRALKLKPDAVEALYGKALIQAFFKSDDQSAEKTCQKALVLSPGDARLHYLMAQIYSKKATGQGRAIREVEKAVSLNPNLTDAHLLRAELLLRANRIRESIDALKEIVRIEPHDSRAHDLLGLLYRETGNIRRSNFHRAFFERLAAAPRSP